MTHEPSSACLTARKSSPLITAFRVSGVMCLGSTSFWAARLDRAAGEPAQPRERSRGGHARAVQERAPADSRRRSMSRDRELVCVMTSRARYFLSDFD